MLLVPAPLANGKEKKFIYRDNADIGGQWQFPVHIMMLNEMLYACCFGLVGARVAAG